VNNPPTCVFLDTNVYIGVYLTARNGHAECFVSSNHELIQALVHETGEFECLTPEQFVGKYLR